MSNHSETFGPFVTNKFGERYLPSINGETFSQVGSDNFYQRHYGAMFEGKECLFSILGTDGGLLLQWILGKKPPQGTRFIFLELPEMIDYLGREGILPETFPPHVSICPVEKWPEKASAFSMKDYYYIGKNIAIRSLGVIDGFYPDYVNLNGEFDRIFGQTEIELGQEIGSKIFMLRGLENLPGNRVPVSVLHNKFQRMTAVLMAGGPSLDESFEWVRSHRKDIIVLAVARIGGQLKREKIVPDLIYAIDPHEIIFHLSKDILAFGKESLLVNMYHLNSRLLGQWCGQSMYMGTLFPWKTPLNTENPSYPGITVSHQALGSAVHMGFSQVILCGFDLCFNKEGFTHASGSLEVRTGPSAYRSDLWVETNGGWKAETSADLFNAIPALSQLAETGKSRGCRVCNPSRGSAKIAHVEHVPWEEIVPESREIPARETFLHRIPRETREDRLQHFAMVETELFRVRSELLTIQKLTSEALKCNQGLFGRKNKPMDYKYKLRMDAIEETLNTDHGELTRLVKQWNIIGFLRLGSPDKEKVLSDQEVERAGLNYYEIYHNNTVDLIKVIDLARQRIRANSDAEKEKPPFKSIFQQWKSDGQPGRALCFLEKRQLSVETLPEPVAKLFRAALQEYQTLLDATETDYRAHCQRNLASPEAIRIKAQSFLHKKEFEKLTNFMHGIAKSPIPNKEQFLLLIQGYLADHRESYDEALEHFKQITLDGLRHESLRCMLAIHLKRSELQDALYTAGKLSQLSQVFIPIYANLQRLNGYSEEALVTYTNYMKHAPKDTLTETRLGMLHAELGHSKEAALVFQDILEKDPDNKAAKLYLEEVKQQP
ncbi:MAG: DUF115 domain-containing protein [Magnetococcales bacterium]|nr:DUF115 domain-containing protein [Magnetococcales bacterium]